MGIEPTYAQDRMRLRREFKRRQIAAFDTIDAALNAITDNKRFNARSTYIGGDDACEWYTPAAIVEAARRTMGGIDLDPYSCPLANESINAERIFTEEDPAEDHEWRGRLSINPPFDTGNMRYVAMRLAEGADYHQAILICNVNYETQAGALMLDVCESYCLVQERVRFRHFGGERTSGLSIPQVVYGFEVNREAFRREFSSFGHVVEQREAEDRRERQAARKLRDIEARKKLVERRNGPPTDGLEIHHCSCGDLIDKVGPGSVDVICNDPPYGKEHLGCWSELAEFAALALKPGGQLLALSGQTWLPGVIDRLRVEGLAYRWTFSMQYKGASSYTSFDRAVQSDWKPVLVFEKTGKRLGGHHCHDVITVGGTEDADKERHRWGQNEDAFRELLAKFADPGMTVCDPFLGGGTTAVVARELGCSFVGCDVDAECVATTWDEISLREPLEAAA